MAELIAENLLMALLAAIGALFGALVGVVGFCAKIGVELWKSDRGAWESRMGRCEEQRDRCVEQAVDAAEVLRKQNETQAEVIVLLQRSLTKGGDR